MLELAAGMDALEARLPLVTIIRLDKKLRRMNKEFESLLKCDICDGLYLPSRYEDHCNGMRHEAAFQALAKSFGI
jgi:hypothetical protein